MPVRIPPMQLPSSVINERIAKGAKTIEEVDPELASWMRKGLYYWFNRKKVDEMLKRKIF